MISDKHRCIYIHPPKCAGLTIEKLLSGASLDASYQGYSRIRHAGAKFYKKKFPKQFGSYFVFASTRNPWDRVVSRYFSFVEARKYHHPKLRKSITKYDFNDAVKHSPLAKSMHTVFSKISIKGSVATDEIIHFNNYEEDLRRVFNNIGVHFENIPHKNKSEHKPYWEYYNDQSKQMVSEFFKKDIEYFGYEFGK